MLIFARLRGALSLLGLGASLALVLVFVVPAILDGKSPLAVAIVGALAVALITIPLAHGRGPKTLAAVLGTAASLLLTALLALIFTKATHLTGFSNEEAAFLDLAGADISLEGMLLAGMVIAALGVLDDVTVSQASTVLALRTANPSLRLRRLFRLAQRVGRDHVSATVNTLVLAYVGAALPVLLMFSSSDLSFGAGALHRDGRDADRGHAGRLDRPDRRRAADDRAGDPAGAGRAGATGRKRPSRLTPQLPLASQAVTAKTLAFDPRRRTVFWNGRRRLPTSTLKPRPPSRDTSTP